MVGRGCVTTYRSRLGVRSTQMVWLTSQSVGLLIVGCLAIAGLVAIVSRYTARAVIPERQRDAAHGISSPLMSPLGAAFAILAALTLANEAGYLSSAESIVSSEAGNASRLAWAATSPGVNPKPLSTLRWCATSLRRGPTNGVVRLPPEGTTQRLRTPSLTWRRLCERKRPGRRSARPPAPNSWPQWTRSPPTAVRASPRHPDNCPAFM